jgi:plastocyanin
MKKVLGLVILLSVTCVLVLVAKSQRANDRRRTFQQIIVPEEDRFTPFGITIRQGDTVKWINRDTDDHTVVSDDFFNTAGHNGTDVLLLGTDNNNGQPGTFTLRFNRAGQFVYYCRFHSHLDGDHQPVAPGPDGGIQDPNGNFGTAMMGVITVLPERDDDRDRE